MFMEGRVSLEMGLHELGKLSDINLTRWPVDMWVGRFLSRL